MRAGPRRRLALRAYLLHLSHYDPAWLARKARERPIDLRLAAQIVDALAAAGFNALIVVCEDGVRYRTHPELRRPYSISMAGLGRLAARARCRGLDVVPKLNFAQSARHQHNHWFRPHHDRFDDEEYWRRAFLVIDELIRACRPHRFFRPRRPSVRGHAPASGPPQSVNWLSRHTLLAAGRSTTRPSAFCGRRRGRSQTPLCSPGGVFAAR